MSYNPDVKSLFFRGVRPALSRAIAMLEDHGKDYPFKLECIYHREKMSGGRLADRLGCLIATTAVKKNFEDVSVREALFSEVDRLLHGGPGAKDATAHSALATVQTAHEQRRTQLRHKLRQAAGAWLLKLERRREALEGCGSERTAAALHTLTEHALLPMAAFEPSASETGLGSLLRRLRCARDCVDEALEEQDALVAPAATGNALFDRLAAISTPLGFYESDYLVLLDYEEMEVIRLEASEVAAGPPASWWVHGRRYQKRSKQHKTWATVTGTPEDDFVPYQPPPPEDTKFGDDSWATTPEEDDEKMSASTSEKDSGCCSEVEEEYPNEEGRVGKKI